MAVRPILQLGSAQLHEVSVPVEQQDLPDLEAEVRDLHDTMRTFQTEHGWGRAIAAPQIGVRRGFVAMHVDRPLTFFNPVLDQLSEETRDYWEDCMSFPGLLVRIRMPRACRLTWRDESWVERRAWLTDDFAALLQHEVDHLDGVLATQRAVDERSLALRSTQPPKELALRGVFEPLG